MNLNLFESELFINLIKQKPNIIALYLEDALKDPETLKISIVGELLPALHKAFPEEERNDGRKESN